MPTFAEAASPVNMLPYGLGGVLLVSLIGGPILREAARRGADLRLSLRSAWLTYLAVNVAFVVAAVPINMFLLADKDATQGDGQTLLYIGNAIAYHLALAATISRVYGVPFFGGLWTVFVMDIITTVLAAIVGGLVVAGCLAVMLTRGG